MIGLLRILAERAIKDTGQTRSSIITVDGYAMPCSRGAAQMCPSAYPASARYYALLDACRLRMGNR